MIVEEALKTKMESGTMNKIATNNGSCGSQQSTIQTLLDINAMIDIHAKHLEGLRTQCSTSAELIQQEIRTIEGKLVKSFSKQLVAKAKIKSEELPKEVRDVPSVKQWLQVVGVSQASVESLCTKIHSLEILQEMSDHEIRRFCSECGTKEDELRRLIRALQNLRRYTEALIQSEKEENSGRTTPDLTLYWDSWDGANVPTTYSGLHNEASMQNLSLATSSATNHNSSTQILSPDIHCTPPSTPSPSVLKGKGDRIKFPATPPARKKNQVVGGVAAPLTDFPLTKSTSHESQLANRVGDANESSGMEQLQTAAGGNGVRDEKCSPSLPPSMGTLAGGSASATSTPGRAPRHRLPTEPCGSAASLPTTMTSTSTSSTDLQHPQLTDTNGDHLPKSGTPKSPRTPTVGGAVMVHSISHRFTMTFKMLTVCDLCLKQMFIGLKCKECKYKCHRDCAAKVPPSCKLPPEFIDYFRHRMTDGPPTPIMTRPGVGINVGSSMMSVPSPSMIRLTPQDKKKSRTQPAIHMTQGGSTTGLGYGLGLGSTSHFDSSSTTSSCSSSTPSSPALIMSSHMSTSSTQTPPSASQHTQFRFPDVHQADRAHSVEALSPLTHPTPSAKVSALNLTASVGGISHQSQMTGETTFAASQKSHDSDKTVSVSGLSGTSGSNSTSTDSERTYRVDSQDSQVSDTETTGSDRHWPRQNSLSLREWDIPFHELELGDLIGQGRFGRVHRGNWHGDVAIRLLDMDQVGDEKVLESFKHEVATFRKTRHENLVLFMGACMNLPTLALVTSMCKGLTLYKHLHLRKDKFSMNRTIIIAQQISQGMGYLHARGIVHKDLKSKNIFLENGKVIITDFGLFSVSKLCKSDGRTDALSIPPGWLCYLAPEVMRCLKPSSEDNDQLPFTMASDVYSFGTVWYELLCGEWPFKDHSPEAMIWQIGCGMKQSLANLQASRDLKDILMACWAYDVEHRAEFSKLLKILERLPKKRLLRSPSHPVHLSRSAESVF